MTRFIVISSDDPLFTAVAAMIAQKNSSQQGETAVKHIPAANGGEGTSSLSGQPAAPTPEQKVAEDGVRRVVARCGSAGSRSYLKAIADFFRTHPGRTDFTFDELHQSSGISKGDLTSYNRVVGKPQKTEGVALLDSKWDALNRRMVFHVTPEHRDALIKVLA